MQAISGKYGRARESTSFLINYRLMQMVIYDNNH